MPGGPGGRAGRPAGHHHHLTEEWWDPWDDDPEAFAAGFEAAGPWCAEEANAAEAVAIWRAQQSDRPPWPLLGRYPKAPGPAGFVLGVWAIVNARRPRVVPLGHDPGRR